MAIEPGTRFGPYEVADEIGAGGMGIVYRATDTKLDREVAIKVLPESMASDADRIARFDREAKMLAALNHPNIAQIHGLEESDGTTALIMELIEGPTLADRIEQGPIPADEALGIAMQIAEALEAAHGKNIVHRDLKPANIKLRPDGTVKVLDFGIAKALEPENLTSGPQSPMMTTPATMAGVILGTAAYMSPEQAKGKQIDQRTDIWAFGVLLYEMLTGQLAFGAEDIPTTLARVIANEADIDSLPGSISPAVRQTIALCLQKDVKKRVRDIGDVRLALEGAFETAAADATAVAQPLWHRALPLTAAVLVTGVLVGLAGELLRPTPESSSTTSASSSTGMQRFEFNAGATSPLGQVAIDAEVAVSPDGSRFVYAANVGGEGIRLYSRTLEQFDAQPMPGTEGGRNPFFSPDGGWIGYASGMGTQLKKVSVRGGPPQNLVEGLVRDYGGSWGTDDSIVFSDAYDSNNLTGRLSRVSALGGTLEVLLSPEPGTSYVWPHLLPGGRAILFTIRETAGLASEGSVAVLSLDTGEHRPLIAGGFNARYAPTGHIVFARAGALWGVPFDLERLEITGIETPLVDGVQMNSLTGHAPYNFSDDGLLAYVRGREISSRGFAVRDLIWVDRNGREEILAAEQRTYQYPRLSPDGQRLAVSIFDIRGTTDIFVLDLVRGTSSRLTFAPGVNDRPLWTPDGEQILFNSNRDGGGLFRRASNGTGQATVIYEDAEQGSLYPDSFSPDGTQLVYREFNAGGNIHVLSLESDLTSQPLLQEPFNENVASLSPDGRWLAYTSDETGEGEVYVRPFPNTDDGKWQISTDGGDEPLWGPDGQELFFLNEADDGDAEIFMVRVAGEPTFSAGAPETLFSGEYIFEGQSPNWDISPDGQRFLMMRNAAQTAGNDQTSIAIVDNWFEDLRRLAPTTERSECPLSRKQTSKKCALEPN